AAIKKLCELCLHVEVSDELSADAVARERAAFVSRCTDRLARAADTLRAEASPSEGGSVGVEAQQRKTAVVSATRSLQLLLAYLEEAGDRMRAQGLSVHSHCGNHCGNQQLLQHSRGMMAVRVQSSGGKETELQVFPGQTVQSFRVAVAIGLGPEWTAGTTRLLYRGREMDADDKTLEEQGVLEGSVVHAAKRLTPQTSEQRTTNTPRTKLTLRVRPPQPDGEKATPTVLGP
ncbi:unnamed protein product, partial [Ectocarpus sp. 12 AP-2014]